MDKFTIGSNYFFSEYLDFSPSDYDTLEFEENPTMYKTCMQLRARDKTRCHFWWRKMSPDEFVEYTLSSKVPMEIGKFLIPEVNEYLGFTLEHLKKLEPIVENLDDRHKYEQIIFNSYIQNKDFTLTQEQRNKAYEEYKKYR